MKTRKNAAFFETEVWKDIPGYEGRYQASSFGRIKSLGRWFNRADWRTGLITKVRVPERILAAARFNSLGHLSVYLRDETHPDGIGKPVHQLVLLTFIGPAPAGLEVLHKNGIPTDNSISNLRYDTRSENMTDRYRHSGKGLKLTVDNVIQIRKLLCEGIPQRQIAKTFGVSDTTIYYIKTGRRFKWIK
jgi:hypothetical protein